MKLGDLAALLQSYQEWLQDHQLQDAGGLLEHVTRRLNEAPPAIYWDTVWVDGFADLSGQEVELLAAVIGRSGKATVTFSDDPARQNATWLSPWWVTRRSLERVERRLRSLPGVSMERVPISRLRGGGRFSRSLVLARLEAEWFQPVANRQSSPGEALLPGDTLRVVACDTPEQETVFCRPRNPAVCATWRSLPGGAGISAFPGELLPRIAAYLRPISYSVLHGSA